MLRHAARTLVQYGLVLFVAICLNFALPRLAPGNPVDFLLPSEQAGTLTPAQRAQVLGQFGLDKPVPIQFERYVAGLVHGDLAYSVHYGRPVHDLLAERLPWTALLVGASVLLSTMLGVTMGFRSGWRRGTTGDVGLLSLVMFIDSMPPFFVGTLLLLIFSVHLGLLPIFGAIPSVESHGPMLVVEVAKRLILPLVTLTLATLGSVYLVARSAMVAELHEDYVLAAEAKGLSPAAVRGHVQRNALLPVWTLVLLNVGALAGGATIVETVFSYPGLGRLIYESVISRDYPMLQGAFLVLTLFVVAANILADLLYPLLDPRVRRPVRATAT